MKNKKGIIIYVLVAAILLSITFGISYAYFTATVTGNNSATETRITAGILDIKFNISDNINNTNIMLVKDENRYKKAETIDFTVSNNGRGNIDGVYYIYLTDLTISNNLKSPDFKWELIKNNNIVFSGNFVNATTDNDFTLTQVDNNDIKQTITVGNTDTYKLRIWLSETQEDQTNLLEGEFSAKIRVISSQLTSNDIPTAPEPELYQGLIPVIYDSNGKTIVANTNSTWYDYDNHMWANAVLGTSTARAKSAGEVLNDSEILQYYVWIPRYRYQLFNAVAGESADEQMINIEFESKYKTKSNGTNNGEWLTHPAFTFGDAELDGIWVGKFETSHSDSQYVNSTTANKLGCSNENCLSASGLIIKPNVISMVYNNISNEFYVSRSIENSTLLGLNSSEVDTHLMKNMEWGAVAYLSSSKYGLYSSANTCYNSDNNKTVTINGSNVNRCEVWINNVYTGTGCGVNSDYSISACGGAITGCSAQTGISQGAKTSQTSCTSINNIDYSWNSPTNNGRSSTTGNIYGIYDISGGANEYVMGNQSSSTEEYVWYSKNSGFSNQLEAKYFNQYLASNYNTMEETERRDQGRGLLGDATREIMKTYGTDGGGWFSDYAIFVSGPYPWFTRGGYAYDGAHAGVFSFSRKSGGADTNYSFRVVLSAQ